MNLLSNLKRQQTMAKQDAILHSNSIPLAVIVLGHLLQLVFVYCRALTIKHFELLHKNHLLNYAISSCCFHVYVNNVFKDIYQHVFVLKSSPPGCFITFLLSLETPHIEANICSFTSSRIITGSDE